MSSAHVPQLDVAAPGAPVTRSFDLVGPALIDLLLFNLAILAGAGLGPAHIASFAVATLISYFVVKRPLLAASRRGSRPWLHAGLLGASLMALFLRGGVLALLTLHWGWPPAVAIVPALLAGGAVNTVASGLLLRPIARDRSELISLLAGAVFLYTFLLRLVYLGQVQLLPEETYYWNYWQHPAMGYLDHPPMVAWLIGLGTSLFGNTELGVRAGVLLTQAVASFFAYRLTRNLFGHKSALAALILMQVLPFYFLSGMMMTPDAPLIAAWAGCLYFLERALLAERARAWWGVGICLGLGLVSKYTIGLLVPATLLFVLLDPQARRWLLRWEPYAAAALALAIFSPVLIWNAQHDWASFAFQTTRRLADPARFSLHRLILSVLVLITPAGLASIPIILSHPVAEGSAAARVGGALRFTRVFVLVPFAVFAVFSLRHEVKLDWTGAMWLAAVPALACWIAGEGVQMRASSARIHAAWLPTGVATLVLLGGCLHYLVLGLPGVGPGTNMELVPIGWRQLGEKINAIAAQLPGTSGRPLVVGMDRYALASEIAFYSPDRAVSVARTASVSLFGGIGLMYQQWFPDDSERGRTLLVVAWRAGDLSAQNLGSHAESLLPIQSLPLIRDGELIRRVYYRVAYGYQLPGHKASKPDEAGGAQGTRGS